jgi:hypothetical protein
MQKEPAEPLLSPARGALRQANAELRRRQEAFEDANRACQSLEAVITGARAADDELARLQGERQRRHGEWLAGGQQGQRPAPSRDEIRAEEAVRIARDDAGAAELGLPRLLARRHAALSALNAARQQRDVVHVAAAVEAAAELVEREYRPALLGPLKIEARLRSLQDQLFILGNAPPGLNAALAAAAQVGELIKEAKAQTGVHRDDATGAAFLNEIGRDPAATLWRSRNDDVDRSNSRRVGAGGIFGIGRTR